MAQCDAARGAEIAVLCPLSTPIQELEVRCRDMVDAMAVHNGGEFIETVTCVESEPAGGRQLDCFAALILHRPVAPVAAVHEDFRPVFVNHMQA